MLLSGTVYTARDAAHKRLMELLDRGEPLPFPVKGSAVYYVGPTPERPGEVIGSAGPTTSGRMDPYSPRPLDLGQTGLWVWLTSAGLLRQVQTGQIGGGTALIQVTAVGI